LEADIDARILDLTALIRSEISQKRPIDMSSVAQYFTLDVLTHIAFGAPFGYLTQNKDIYDYIKTVSEFLQVLELGANCSSVQSLLSSPLMKPMQPKATDKVGMGAMMGVAKQIVSERFQPGAKPVPDMMGSFVKHGLTQEECESEAMVQVLGGSDSTATAIRMIILHIITNPRVYINVMEELDSNNHVISYPVITSAESRKLPYMQACIKEGLRIFPPLQALNSKLAPPGGETVNGIFIPGGIEVAYSSYTTQRRKDIFGEDAQYFRPERWIEAAAVDDGGVKLTAMENTLDLIFGSGRFSCLGKHIAFIELDKVIPTLLREFDWGLVNPVRHIETKCFGVFVQRGLFLRATERMSVK
jgi:cytochrome P450